jgi:OmpA-OmpF porin, OOP family
MATNLLDLLKGVVTPDLVSRACEMLGESEGATTKALGAVFPTVLDGLLNKAQDSGAMGQIFGLLKDSANDGSILNNAGSLLGAAPQSPVAALGEKFLSAIFGEKLGPVAGVLGNFAGIKSSSASSLLSMAGPVIMGVLGNQIKKGGLNVSGLVNLLLGQKEGILAAAPQALAGLLGLGSLKDLGGKLMAGAAEGGKKSAGWIWPLLVILAAIVLVWYLLRGCDTTQKPVAAIDTMATKTLVVAQKVDSTVGKLGAFLKKALPTNVQLNIPEFGIENTLLAFIQDAAKPVDKTTWFDFDRLVFETGSATLKPESQEQLTNIAEILKAYPAVKVKVGGYTDNVGNPTSNMKLSQDRANNVMKDLLAKGIAADRMVAEGYGDQHPVADNNTPEGRALNRRIALRVTAK